jgi:hypothetical protein
MKSWGTRSEEKSSIFSNREGNIKVPNQEMKLLIRNMM